MTQPVANPEFEALLDHLKHKQGCDLTGYKRSTLMRRFQHRMRNIRIDNYQSYLKYLQYHPEEPNFLLNDILINFTGFFRDGNAWAYLAAEIVPQIIASKKADEPIRIWSAGCASGQEVYTLLMLLAEELGVEFCLQRIQCYATDVDAEALQQAQKASYNAFEIINLPSNLLEKYFEKDGEAYIFHQELHRLITFNQHDLMKDPPLQAVDLLICRNVLMYFTLEAQEFILSHFYAALSNLGFLFLGRAELLVHHRQFFTLSSLQQRIYTKT
ncbi:MAG TPA: protein-glutamate O-methyltransferase CheR [Trichocoleus sp.]